MDIPKPLSYREQLYKLRRMKRVFLSKDVYVLDVWKKLRGTEAALQKRIKAEDEASAKKGKTDA